jgi:triosephosphate isomerase (TIM)
MNKTYIIANWKMNPASVKEAQDLFAAVEKGVKEIENAEVVLCPPFVYLPGIQSSSIATVRLGAQDCFWEERGAYTGEVSPGMLKALGCEYVILGHSERAKYLGETEDMVQKKAGAAYKAGLKVVWCLGDNEPLPSAQENLLVVYEPEWAISTEGGKAASPEQVAERVSEMRAMLKDTPILYGGSVNSSNIGMFLKEAGVNGVLVGSASLDAEEFVSLVKNAVA